MRPLSLLVLVALLLPAVALAQIEGPQTAALSGQGLRPAAQSCQTEEQVFLPTGDLFNPLIADPKEPRFYLSYRLFKFRTTQIHAAVGGYGEFFGLYRYNNPNNGYSWQADFGGAIHAQFDLHAPSLDLVNADYTIGFPVSFRKGNESYRVALYHQSSHLGDEFLLHNKIDRIELSYEALELLRSHEWGSWRLYYGMDAIVHQGPTHLKPFTIQTGVEFYDTHPVVGRGRLIGGLDLKIDQEHDWSTNASLKTGFQFDSSSGNGRYIRFLAEGYKGFTPYGQFYNDRIFYAGIGVYLGFE